MQGPFLDSCILSRFHKLTLYLVFEHFLGETGVGAQRIKDERVEFKF